MKVVDALKRFRFQFGLTKTAAAKVAGVQLPSYTYETVGKCSPFYNCNVA